MAPVIPASHRNLIEKVGSRPFGAVTGVLGGAALGALAGMAAGPVGSLFGAVGGALIGGVLNASTRVGPEVHVARQDRHWRSHYATRPYVPAGANYADYGPAYRLGARAYLRGARRRDWRGVEDELAGEWVAGKGASRLAWEDAKPAVRDAWDRLDNATDVQEEKR